MMAQAEPALGFLPKLVVALGIALLAAGAIRYDATAETLQRLWNDLVNRPGGPMTFRFILQPAMATLAALYDGVSDARANRSPYFWTVLHKPEERTSRLNEGLASTARIILLGIVMDAIYQWRVLDAFYPVESLLIAVALAFIPYLILRGPIARVARWWMHRGHDSAPRHWG